MVNVFWVQVRALIWKNWIVLYKRPFVGFSSFPQRVDRVLSFPRIWFILAESQIFFNRLSKVSFGRVV